jgi:DNA-binding NarL/FixJ family response regulator
MDGIEATRLITRLVDPPSVLVLTTYDLDEHVVEALRAGASGSCSRTCRPTSSCRPSGWSTPARRSSRRR